MASSSELHEPGDGAEPPTQRTVVPPYSVHMFSRPPLEVPRVILDPEEIQAANGGVACGGIRFVTAPRRDKSKGPSIR